MKWITTDDIRLKYQTQSDWGEYITTIGRKSIDPEYIEQKLGLPFHLAFIIPELTKEMDNLPDDILDAIPFYSLCKGLFLPLSGLLPERVEQIFGLKIDKTLDYSEREDLLQTFLRQDIGLSIVQKLACLLGDPFRGKPAAFRRDSLIKVLESMQLKRHDEVLDRLTMVGDVAILFAENRSSLKGSQPLTSAEVLETLRLMRPKGRKIKAKLLRVLFERCGRLEAYFLAKLVLRKAGFGFHYEGKLLAKLMGAYFDVNAEQVEHAIALSSPFDTVRILEHEGADGIKKIQLKPLSPVRPSLAGGVVDGTETYPVWVERKYDGIRLMLHKSTDQMGTALCGAYSRNRRDFLEQIPNMDTTIKLIPGHSFILDGELYGSVLDMNGLRPASVYEVFGSFQGGSERPVNLRFATFDILYFNGQDFTSLPLMQRRQQLMTLLMPLTNFSLPVPITISDGQLANSKEEVSKLFHHFRAQGYEGIVTKDQNGPYYLAVRDPAWRKLKPEITLDLILTGAIFAANSKKSMFSSYTLGAKKPEGGLQDIGTVAGVDRERDLEIQHLIMREGIISGQRIQHKSASGTLPGMALNPRIVVSVKFEGVVKNSDTGELSLRDPKLVVIRGDKNPLEADSMVAIEKLFLHQRIG